MPTLAKRIERFFLGEDRNDEKDAKIAEFTAQIKQNTQVTQSGARVINHMSGMMKLMAEGHVKK